MPPEFYGTLLASVHLSSSPCVCSHTAPSGRPGLLFSHLENGGKAQRDEVTGPKETTSRSLPNPCKHCSYWATLPFSRTSGTKLDQHQPLLKIPLSRPRPGCCKRVTYACSSNGLVRLASGPRRRRSKAKGPKGAATAEQGSLITARSILAASPERGKAATTHWADCSREANRSKLPKNDSSPLRLLSLNASRHSAPARDLAD